MARIHVLGAVVGFSLLACGSRGSGTFDDAGNGDGGISQECIDNPFLPECNGQLDEAGNEAAPPCENLKCQQVSCGGGATTNITGTVWDPAGKNPLYGVVVYVPNSPGGALDPIPHGPVCDSCGGANVSGKPIVTTLTDPKGKFILKDVPVGANIPLVIQAGKWRRKLLIPNVQQCVDNPIANPMDPNTRLRFPRNKNEFGGVNGGASMPLIGLAGGCDPVHILMQKIGIDVSEFTPNSGNGMVRVYSGMGGQNAGVGSATDAYATFWASKAEMFKYDIIINECECAPYARDTGGPGYTNTRLFLDAGGRMFNTHYHLNFFGPSSENGGKADMEFQQAATWGLWGMAGFASPPFTIDTTFPKGKAMDDWLENLKTASTWGPGIKTTAKGQITAYTNGDIAGTKMGISQRWVYTSAGPLYISINTPTSFMPDKRCGRAVASDLHVGNGSLTTMIEQEAALEFMFFDLAACVIADDTVPVPPLPN